MGAKVSKPRLMCRTLEHNMCNVCRLESFLRVMWTFAIEQQGATT